MQVRVMLLCLVAGIAGCNDAVETTAANREAPTTSLATPARASDTLPSAQGTLPLPVNQTFAGNGPALKITQTATGAAGVFGISYIASGSNALLGTSNGAGVAVRGQMSGAGRAGLFEISNAGNSNKALTATTNGNGYAFWATNTGLSNAGVFEITNPASGASVVAASGNGSGSAVDGFMSGTGQAGQFIVNNPNNTNEGVLISSNGRGTGLLVENSGLGRAAFLRNTNLQPSEVLMVSGNNGASAPPVAVIDNVNTNGSPSLKVVGNSTGPVLQIQNTTTQIQQTATVDVQSPYFGELAIGKNASGFVAVCPNLTNSCTGLFTTGVVNGYKLDVREALVGNNLTVANNLTVSGAKNAVVPTSAGQRLVYSEESAEVWFTDYGFGRLVRGRVHIAIDPLFAETVTLGEPYHVFLQAYDGDGELHVANRTATGFDVVGARGAKNLEFSYRVVARRKGYETKRLEKR